MTRSGPAATQPAPTRMVSGMGRLHLIEFHEQDWFPAPIRNGLRAVLQKISSTLPGYEAITEVLLEAMAASGSTSVLDLCAGAGGPWVRLAPRLAEDPRIEQVLLTDLFPDMEAMEAMQSETAGLVRPHAESVDALAVPPQLPGFRTVLAAFHHFEPERARALLANAVAAGEGVGIFELTERSAYCTAFVGLNTIPLSLALSPFIRPRRWSHLALTYLLPLVPATITFDGIVSCLRTYKPDELLAMAREVGPDYEWQAGRVRAPWSPLWVVYLVGVPPRTTGH